tara:strand:+ start:88 stop:864 length:777 start_codon:yes stop_codon:yes gene_type:complete
MKVVIFAGGYGSRIGEETVNKPKPMIEIGGEPILWHIMKIYSYYGFNDFVILLGYKGYLIKEYFSNYYRHNADIYVDLELNEIKYKQNKSEPWKVNLIDTGEDTMTGGRLNRVKSLLNDETFMLTYGDGVADIDINKLLLFHKSHGKSVTMTSVQPEGRFGALKIDQNTSLVTDFVEKPAGDGVWINGGFFVCEPTVFDYINDEDETIFERSPLENLTKDGELYAYKHKGFWKPMDMLRDKIELEKLIQTNKAPWKIW